VQGRAEPGAAGAQDQEIGLEDVDGALRGDYSPGPGPGAIRRAPAVPKSARSRLGQIDETPAGGAEAHASFTSAAPSKRPPWVSNTVTLSVPDSVALNAKPKDGFSPMEVEVSNSAMSRPR
jgi:hypothetical protein